MSIILTRGNVNQDLYARSLSNAYRIGQRVYDSSFALAQDPNAYEKVLRDPTVAHAIRYRKHLIAGRTYNSIPASNSQIDTQAATVMEQLIFPNIRDFTDSLYNLSEAVFRGNAWSYIEGRRIYCALPGDIVRCWWVPTRLREIDRRRFRQVVDKDRKIKWEVWSYTRFRWEELEHPEWFVRNIYENTETTLGYGRGLLDALYYYFYAKTIIMEQGLQGIERWAQGLITVAIDEDRPVKPGVSTEQIQQSYLTELEKTRSKHILTHSKSDELRVITGGGEGWQLVKEMIGYLDNEMTKLILGSTLPTNATTGGSYALAQVQENSTEALIRYDRQVLSEAISDDLFRLVWRLNRKNFIDIGLGDAHIPSFAITQEKIQDPLQSAQLVQILRTTGVDLRKDEVYERVGFTKPDARDEIFTGAVTPPTAPAGLALQSNGNGKFIR